MADGPDRQTELTLDLNEQVNLVRIAASEGLSQHFTITLDLTASLGEIDFLKHLGKPATVKVYEDDQEQRFFNGLIVDAEFVGEVERRGYHYRLTLRPAAHFHSQGRNFRIFQEMTTKDIIAKVLDGCSITHNFKTTRDTPLRAYCVQYGESDFGFVRRLMEEDGLYYFYEHSQGQHDLTICDAPGSHKEGKASPLIFKEASSFVGTVNSANRFTGGQKQYVHSWHERVSSGAELKVTLRDFDFMVPKLVKGEAAGDNQHPVDEVEFYHYPARTFVDDVSKARSDVVLEGRRAGRRIYTADSVDPAICCGKTFTLTEHPIERFNGKSYLVANTHHVIASETYASDIGFENGTEIHIEAVPAEVQWRAPMISRRPVVLGPETAWVTGPKDEEIYTDKYGRVKVQFHWDREGKLDENSSCWIRVSQTGGLGNIILPRVGHEVVVDFIDGDPDRPLVMGRVFNERHKPIYPLPDNKTIATWRSLTYKEKDFAATGEGWVGIPNVGVNEFRLEDKAGGEEVFLYAQKDMNTRIQNSETHHLGTDLDTKIGKNRTMKIGNDDNVEVVSNRETTIGKMETRTIGSSRQTTIGEDDVLDVGQSIRITAGTEIMIEAGAKITLKVDGSTITMTGSQIEIQTDTLKTNGSVLAEHKGGGAHTIQMAPGMMKIEGTMIKIN
jgi:type VI secretion system secreted protein VgrG